MTQPDGPIAQFGDEGVAGGDGDQGAAGAAAGGGRALLRRPVLWAAAAGGVVLLGYLAAALAVADRVPTGSTVSGLAIGGLGRQQAEQALTRAQQSGPVRVTVQGRAATVDPATAGLTVEAKAVVADLTGFSLNPARLWRQIGGGPRVQTGAGSVDRLNAALRRVATHLDVPAADATVTLTGTTPTITPSSAGTSLDVPAAAAALRRGWLADAPVPLPVRTTPAKIDDAQAQKALDQLVKPALSGPLVVKAGARSVSLDPQTLAPAIRLAPGPEGLVLAIDGAVLKRAVLAKDPAVETRPKDARIVLKAGKPAIEPDQPGQALAPDGLAEAARVALLQPAGGESRTAVAPTTASQAKLTAAQAATLGVKERVSTFSTNLTANPLRTENLTVAARTVKGTLVLPGQSFSLNATLGQRTKAKGYNEAPAINGGRLVQDVGGGVSQMATTIFNNVFFAGLQDIYHKPHSFYISRYPEGREATVYWPTVDLKWRNDSPYAVLIDASVSDGQVHVSFWSTKVWEIKSQTSGRSNYRTPGLVHDPAPGCVSQEANSGFDVSVKRLFYRGGVLVKSQTWNTSYIAEDKVVCGPEPATPTR